MIELQLTREDKKKIKADIKISFILIGLFYLVLFTMIAITFFALLLLKRPLTSGFANRGIFIAMLLVLPLIALSWQNILQYIDLKKGKKLQFQIKDYQLLQTKKKIYFLTKNQPKLKLNFSVELIPLLK